MDEFLEGRATRSVYHGILKALEAGAVASRQRLTETVLATHFGVGRNAMREAMQRFLADAKSIPERPVIGLGAALRDVLHGLLKAVASLIGRPAIGLEQRLDRDPIDQGQQLPRTIDGIC
jgi:hypothetical protein